MGQSGVRPIGNLFWDIGLIASYLLYWSLVIYPMTSDELKGVRGNCTSSYDRYGTRCGADIPDMVRVKAEETTRAPITIIVRGNISS